MTKLMHNYVIWNVFYYYNPVQVSSNTVLIIRRSNYINTASGIVPSLSDHQVWRLRKNLLNLHKLSERRLTADWLAPRENDCSRMRSKVSSDWLPSYIKATWPVLEIFKMAGYFPDSPRIDSAKDDAWLHSVATCFMLNSRRPPEAIKSLAFRLQNHNIFRFIKPTLHALKCEHNRHKISYMFRHFLSAIIRENSYRLKFCPSNLSVMCDTVTH